MEEVHRQLDRREKIIVALIDQMVEATDKALEQALLCFRTGDRELAHAVLAEDREINLLQKNVEEECIVTIAREQPVARDLRIITADMAISNDLERMADHAAGIANTVTQMDRRVLPDYAQAIEGMGLRCREMLSAIHQAYRKLDAERARDVAAMETEIDREEQQLVRSLFEHMKANPDDTEIATYMMWVSHGLERFADRITNIAERIVYMRTAEVVDLNY
jgi:phosphate transport system protein